MVNQQLKLVQEKDGNYLYEWIEDGCPERAWLPKGVEPTAENMERAIPYAKPFFDEDIVINAYTINATLRRHGIWTKSDLTEKPQLATAAMIEVAGLSLAQLYSI